MKKAILIVLVYIGVSCKEKNINVIAGEPKKREVVIKDDIFTIVLNIKILEDDMFDFFYVDDSQVDNFNVKDKLTLKVKGKNEFQEVIFKLPKGIRPYKFRIDLGDNAIRNLSNVDIKSIQLLLNSKSIDIDNSLISSFFQNNIYLEKTENGYSRIVYKDKYDPFITAKEILIKKIKLEL